MPEADSRRWMHVSPPTSGQSRRWASCWMDSYGSRSLGVRHGRWEEGGCDETHWGGSHGGEIPRGPANGFDPDIGQRCLQGGNAEDVQCTGRRGLPRATPLVGERPHHRRGRAGLHLHGWLKLDVMASNQGGPHGRFAAQGTVRSVICGHEPPSADGICVRPRCTDSLLSPLRPPRSLRGGCVCRSDFTFASMRATPRSCRGDSRSPAAAHACIAAVGTACDFSQSVRRLVGGQNFKSSGGPWRASTAGAKSPKLGPIKLWARRAGAAGPVGSEPWRSPKERPITTTSARGNTASSSTGCSLQR